ncbi:MAG: BPSS1780 family membrane protein [Methylophilaceae bacterium]|nr:BPSS1780 family membrane protein [Methylophilaceae bacterium]
MALLTASIKTGFSWISESIALCQQSPKQWMLLALAYLGIFVLLPSLPGLQLLGFVAIIVWPIFIAVAVRLYRNAEYQKQEKPAAIMALIQPKLRKLCLLGLINLVYFTIVSVLLNTDVQMLADLLEKQAQVKDEQMRLVWQTMMPIMLKVIVLFIPLMMALWFSPMLIAFNDYSIKKALKSSIAGVLQYWAAMIAAWLLLSASIVALTLTTSLVAGMLALIHLGFAQTILSMLILACLLISIALTLAFQYVSYRDIFRGAPIA